MGGVLDMDDLMGVSSSVGRTGLGRQSPTRVPSHPSDHNLPVSSKSKQLSYLIGHHTLNHQWQMLPSLSDFLCLNMQDLCYLGGRNSL